MDFKPYLLTQILEHFMSVHSSLRKLGCDILEYPKTSNEMNDLLLKAQQVWSGSRAAAIESYRSAVDPLPSSKVDIRHAFLFLILVGSGHVSNFVVNTVDRTQLMSTRKVKSVMDLAPMIWDGTFVRSYAQTLRGAFRVTDLLRFSRKGGLIDVTLSEYLTYSMRIRLHAGVFKVPRTPDQISSEELSEINCDLPEQLKGEKRSGSRKVEPSETKTYSKVTSKHDDLASEAITCQSGAEKKPSTKYGKASELPSNMNFAPEHFMQELTCDVFKRRGATLIDREYNAHKNHVGDLLFVIDGQIVAVEVKFSDIGATIEQAKKYRTLASAQHAIAITRTDYWVTNDRFEPWAVDVIDTLNSQLYRESEICDVINVNVNSVTTTIYMWLAFIIYLLFRRLLKAFDQPIVPQSGIEESPPNPDGQGEETNKSEIPDQTRAAAQVSVQQMVDEVSNQLGTCNVRHCISTSAAEQVSVRHNSVFSTQVSGKPPPRAKPPTNHRRMW